MPVCQMAAQLHCHHETVRRAINACNIPGVAVLTPGSSRPHRTHTHCSDTSRHRLRTAWCVGCSHRCYVDLLEAQGSGTSQGAVP